MEKLPQTQESVIVFFDKTHKYITKREEDFLMSPEVGEKGMAKLIDGTIVNLKSIAKIVSSSQFRVEYPQKVSEKYENWSEKSFKWENQEVEPIKSMIIGLKRYINSTEENPLIDFHNHKVWYQGTKAPLEILEKMEAKVKEQELAKYQ